MNTRPVNVQFELRKINEVSSMLRTYKANLTSIKGALDNNWQAKEMAYVDSCLDYITNQLSKLSTTLDTLGHDISAVANEINREIAEAEAKAKAEAEAKAKAEAEAEAKAKALANSTTK